MAWAEKLPSGRWRGLYRGPDGKRRNATPGVTYSSEAEAERQAGAREVEQRRPGAMHPEAGRLTWGTWADQWWPRRRVDDSTRVRDRSRRKHHLDPQWDLVPLEDISRDMVESWVLDLAARPDLSASTVQRIYHLFSASMTAAVVARKVAASPCVAIPLERAPLPDETFLEPGQVEDVAFHLRRPYKVLVYLAAYTGLRWGELTALHRQRVHLDAGRIDIHLAWDIKNRTYKTPKDHERRSLPLPPWLVAELRVWFAELGPVDSCGVEHPRKLRSPCTSGLVVPGRNGVPVDYDSFRRKWWMPACHTVEVAATIHDLRHSYASWLIQQGVTIEQVSKLLGHASVLTTMRYAHLASTQWDSVRGALERPTVGDVVPRESHDELAARREDRPHTI